MSLFSYGEYIDDKSFKVVNERVLRGSGAIMFLIGMIAFINGFILKNYAILPYFAGFMVLNFAIGVLINPKLSPTIIIAKLLTRKQSPIWIGAIQKKFAWSLGLALSSAIFIISLLLVNDVSYFSTVCLLCLLCLTLIFLEMGFGVCIGCKLYFGALRLKLLPRPKDNPNCTGDSCDFKTK